MKNYKGKIKKISELTKILDGEKKKGKRVVFSNGCFDLIHVGHIHYLSKAKQKGDILVVALNSDRSVKRLKGVERPLINERDRLEIVASFGFVDYVVLFDEDTPYRVIAQIKPHFLVKGGDYKPDEIVGKEFVEGSGGEVITIPPTSGRSTTDLINRIIARHGKENLNKS